ncbi:hypothetical protein D1007_30577 [Hordeum vulgare]|nr:hypothetical protein D1007_30577 [Hordeum vulgare]
MEVEVKLRLPDAAAHCRLSAYLAPRLLRTDAQRNAFFDAPARPLRGNRSRTVRLLRADKGKAFVDLLNEKANDSGENEMGYVERTLAFSTRHLDDRDIRLMDLTGVTDVLWKRFFQREFGEADMNVAIKRMKESGVRYKWKNLFEHKTEKQKQVEQRMSAGLRNKYEVANAVAGFNLNSTINWDEVEDQYDGHAEDMNYFYVFEESDGENEAAEQNNGGRGSGSNDASHGTEDAGGSGGNGNSSQLADVEEHAPVHSVVNECVAIRQREQATLHECVAVRQRKHATVRMCAAFWEHTIVCEHNACQEHAAEHDRTTLCERTTPPYASSPSSTSSKLSFAIKLSFRGCLSSRGWLSSQNHDGWISSMERGCGVRSESEEKKRRGDVE